MATKKKWVLQAAVFSALRRCFRTYPPYKIVRDRAKEVYYIKSKKGKDLRRVRFKCEGCGKKFDAKNIAVDHVECVIPIEGLPTRSNGLPDFNVYIDRLFCGIENLQLLCKKNCHKAKTAAEAKQRATKRSKTKPTKRKSK